MAGGHPGEEDLDRAARLLLHHAAEHHGPVGADGAEQHDRQDERGGLVVGAAARHLPQLDVRDRHGRDDGGQLVGADAGGSGAFLHRHQLDGAGDHRLELLVGPLAPLQAAGVDHQDVDVAVAHGRLSVGDGVVAVEADGGVDRLPLGLECLAQRRRCRAGEADILGPRAGVEQGGQGDGRRRGQQHEHERGQEGPGAPPLAHLAGGDQPGLPEAVHAATASRNSSDRVGGS
jgi:hypothetical protein